MLPTITIREPGVYDIDEATYHADPVIEPSLSASIGKTILEKSPYHAKLEHPRLNPAYQPEQKKAFDIGSAAHAWLLERHDRMVTIDAPDFRTNAAKEARDAAYAAGKIPLLAKDVAAVRAMAKSARLQLDAHEEAHEAFTNGTPEQTLVWPESVSGGGEVWCRCRLDWLPANPNANVFYDFKSTGASANPEVWGQRTLWDIGADVQVGFYRRGIRAVLGIYEPRFRFVVQECEPPYALSVVELWPEAVAMADAKAEEAIDWWGWCLKRNRWPGYPSRVAYVQAPVWQAKRFEERMQRNRMVADGGEEIKELMIAWQAPLDAEAAE